MSVIKFNRKTIADILSLFGEKHLNLSSEYQDKEKLAEINKAFTVSNMYPANYNSRNGNICFEAKLKDLLSPEDLEKIYQELMPIYESGALYQRNLRNNYDEDEYHTSYELTHIFSNYEFVHPENWKVYIHIYLRCSRGGTSRTTLQTCVDLKQDDYAEYTEKIYWSKNNASPDYYSEFDETQLISGVNDIKAILSRMFCDNLADDIVWSTFAYGINHMYDEDDDDIAFSIAHGYGKRSSYMWMVENCLAIGRVSPTCSNSNGDF